MKEIHAGALARLACCVLVLITFGSMTLHAQFSSGIEGTVTDPSGAAVRNATITLQSLDTGASQTVTSSDAGYYRFNALAAAAFKLTVTASGFKTSCRKTFSCRSRIITTINVVLPVGAAKSEVTVSDAPPAHSNRGG